ncbi:MAG: hypothetical protein OXG77_02350 [Chloroflexi bacterium]|nr:hypothetical protein [Chloroflexota bacterium]
MIGNITSKFLRAALAGLILATLVSFRADAGSQDYPIANGWFYTQTGGDTPDLDDGFSVTDEGAVAFWSAFRELGGVQAVGYPVSRRFVWDGFVSQVFQKVAFQWRPETQSVAFINVFDDLHLKGFDEALQARLIPAQGRFDEPGLSFEQIQARRIELLDAEPALRAHYEGVNDPVLWFGLPQSRVWESEDGLLRTIRLQRAVLQLWTRDVPWAPAGTVTVANGGDEAKALGLWPARAIVPEPAPTLLPPPEDLDLPDFYRQHLNVDGIEVISSGAVPAAALYRAEAIAREMLSDRPDLWVALASAGTKIAVIARSERLTQIPEYADLYELFPDTDWDSPPGGGLGATAALPVASTREANLLCFEDDAYRHSDVLVHVLAQTVLDVGIRAQPGGDQFLARLSQAYDRALAAGLWRHTYASEGIEAYWAEGAQSWFDLNGPPRFDQNDVNTRVELEAYDPELAGLLREVFGTASVNSSCQRVLDVQSNLVEGTILGADGLPPDGVSVWAISGSASHPGVGSPGQIRLRLTDGNYILAVLADDETSCAWFGFYGPDGFADNPIEATIVTVAGAPIAGIQIVLPESVAELCVAWVGPG